MNNRFFLFAILIVFNSCVSDKEEGTVVSDATMYGLAKNPSSFSFYENNSDTLHADPSSPHVVYVRVRFNPRARSVMNDSLNKLEGTVFPDESMIVKEVYRSKGGPLVSYEIMYKVQGAANSGDGWIWSEQSADGNVIYSSAKKGDQCVQCHSQGVNSDLVRTFALH
jgi:hypothetical protein